MQQAESGGELVAVEGARLHLVSTGTGPPVVLVPGWPQSGHAWRHAVPLLVDSGRSVHVVEPRGLGASDKSTAGYDLDTAADDLAAVIRQRLDDGPVHLVGHDLGAWIAHAHHERHAHQVRTLALVDAALPGVTAGPTGIPDDATNTRTWHFGFNRLDGLPEILVTGRERAFLQWLLTSKAVRTEVFDAAAIDEYARVLAAPGALTAGLAYYREVFTPAGLARARERADTPITCPALTVGAVGGVGSLLGDTLQHVAPDLRSVVLDDCGHYVPEEQPEALVAALLELYGGAE